ncbi:hypothetical protein FA13DRAFT_1773846 [Coprinellus micaceus]|uniref:Uncharacterized protein n=1 Tax=Coprinellus micaceus TaxID=71717 RepID=A0A4Y7TEG7_COPMI|nr:hypothetical protein FA13DRAFT_1773846 [Coprinellus micaceus]
MSNITTQQPGTSGTLPAPTMFNSTSRSGVGASGILSRPTTYDPDPFTVTEVLNPPTVTTTLYHSVEASAPPSSTNTVPIPSDPAESDPNMQVLKACSPCGKVDCSFTPMGSSEAQTYSVIIGQPVANCDPSSQELIVTTIGGSLELENSFSVQVTSGVGLGFLGQSVSASTTVTTGNTQKITMSQDTEVKVRPGKIGAVVANISYTTQPGQMKVDTRILSIMSIQPDLVLGMSAVYTDCSSKFQALTLPKVPNCDRNFGTSNAKASLAVLVLIAWTLILQGLISKI